MKSIEVEGLRKEYGPLIAVQDVHFSIEPGQVVGLIGPNGAGKTTLLKMLSTLLRPTRGRAKVLGRDLITEIQSIRRSIGYMPDFFNLYPDLKVGECLSFFAQAYGVDKSLIPQQVDRVLQQVNLTEKKDQYIRNLSRGMVQRIGVAVVLVHSPQVLLLDEPASGLDPEARIQLRNLLRAVSREGKTVIISSHILTELDGFCSHIAIMNEGKLVLYGSVQEIQDRLTKIRQVQISILQDAPQAYELLKTFPGANVLSIQDQTIRLETTSQRETLAEMNSFLIGKGFKVFGFSEISSNLEDLFMKISVHNRFKA